MLDLHAGATLRPGDEPDLDLGRVRGVRPEVPAVDDARRWFPGQHAAPFVLDTLRRPLVDAAAGALLERHGQATLARDGMRGRPPGGRPPSPEIEGVGWRTGDVER